MSLFRRLTIHTLLFLPLLMLTLSANAQSSGESLNSKTVRSVKVYKLFDAQYEMSASDTTVRDGLYTLTYKGMVIEKGQFKNGKKVGVWEYRDLHNLVELRYDFDKRKPTYLLPHEGKKYDRFNYPCTFLGSSLVPFSLSTLVWHTRKRSLTISLEVLSCFVSSSTPTALSKIGRSNRLHLLISLRLCVMSWPSFLSSRGDGSLNCVMVKGLRGSII